MFQVLYTYLTRHQLIIITIAGIVLTGILFIFLGILPGLKPKTPQPYTIEFWGIEDDETVWKEIFDDFHKQYPNLELRYTRFDAENYEDTLVNRLAEGSGPDVFLLKNSWITKHRDKLFPLPQNQFQFSFKDFSGIFVDETEKDLVTAQNAIVGLPLYVDTLVLFYNKDILNAAGIAEPPKNWEDVITISRKLTMKNSAGEITRSGIALGTFDNIAHAFEIISILMLQNGDPIIDTQRNDTVLGEEAIQAFIFYTSFADPTKENYSWNARREHSLDAFADGSVTMIIGSSQDIRRIKAKNPHLNFSILPFPQAKDATFPIAWGDYFFPAVSRISQNSAAAWQFITFAASRDEVSHYLKHTQRAPARRDLIKLGASSAIDDIFFRQTLVAQSWPIPDSHATRGLFREAVESVINRTANPGQAISKLRDQLRLLLPQ